MVDIVVSATTIKTLIFLFFVFFLMIRRPPRSTQSRSSAASDVYKRQDRQRMEEVPGTAGVLGIPVLELFGPNQDRVDLWPGGSYLKGCESEERILGAVSYTHLRAHETVLDLVCRLLLEKKK